MLVCAVTYISNSDVFMIRHIEIKGSAHVDEDEVIRLIDVEQGGNILSWDIDAARQRLLRHPWIKDISISRSFIPTSVTICIQEHTPTATLILKDKPYLISEEGIVFSSSPEDSYGIMIQAGDYDQGITGKELHDILQDAIGAVKIVESKGLKVKDLIIESGGRMDIRLDRGVSLMVLGEMTQIKVDLALRTINEINPASGTIMDLTCEDKIILRNRGYHGS